MKTIRDIPYAPAHGDRGCLDIWTPDGTEAHPVAMVIHGGGLRALSKERMDEVCAFLVGEGCVAVNVNYRLLEHAPFPAQVEDVLAACDWVGTTDHPDVEAHARERIALLGASAGAYLALACGMLLGPERVCAIVSISGPVCRRPGAPGGRLATPPIELISASAPPVLAVHSRNDKLVQPDQSIGLVKRLQAAGADAELYLYDGPGEQHGIWRDDEERPRLLEHVEATIADFVRRTCRA